MDEDRLGKTTGHILMNQIMHVTLNPFSKQINIFIFYSVYVSVLCVHACIRFQKRMEARKIMSGHLHI